MDWFLKKTDWYLTGAVALLLLLSSSILYSLSVNNPDNLSWFYRQLVWIGVGIVCFIVFSLIDYRVFNQGAILAFLYTGGFLTLLAVLIFGTTISGNRAWFSFFGFTFQPVEPIKLLLVMLLAYYFSEKNIEIWRTRHILISAGFLLGFLGLILMQPDVGSGLVLMGIWFLMILLSGARVKQVLALIFLALALFGIGWQWLFTENQKDRILVLTSPNRDPLGVAYSQNQALIAIGSGGLLGKGLGKGSQAQLGFLPAARTDFIFAVLAEELGLVGVLIMIFAFGIIFWRLTQLALLDLSNFIRLFSLGYLSIIFLHTFINLGMNLGFLPVIGIGLPFLSYGGSNLIALFIGLGIINSIRLRI